MKIRLFIFIFLLSANISAQKNLSSGIIEKEITNWEFRMVGDSVWKPAKVPGTIIDNFADLSDISNPLHPYYGDNEKVYQWIGEKDWEFRTSIQIDTALMSNGYSCALILEGIDLVTDFFVDEVMYGIPANVNFITAYSFDWNFFSDPQKTTYEIRFVFHSTEQYVIDKMRSDSLHLPGGEMVYARKPQYEFGWDWAPRFINMGIRKPVKIIYTPHDRPVVGKVQLNIKELKPDEAKIEAKIYVYCNECVKPIIVQYSINKLNIIKDTLSVLDGDNEFTIPITIKNPKLWWPNGMGSSVDYYNFVFEFFTQDEPAPFEIQKFPYALCDIDLIQEKDKYGESFYFKVNGKKVYAKGANYVPDDSFEPGKNTEDLIHQMVGANMNMVRVWGGGMYMDDKFYKRCLERGIMVWQDFMFACALYPGDDYSMFIAESEAKEQVSRLSNFNNLAVWCGNNEIDEGWQNWGWQKELKISPDDSTIIWNNYVELFHKRLKKLVEENDKNTTYITTSPKYGWGRKKSMTHGDAHYWGVWWGLEPIEKYNEKVPRFMSEFGMQAMPDLSTLQKIIPDSAMNFNSPKFKNHQKHPTGFQTLDYYLNEYLVVPDNMEDYAYATQVLQAYALTTAIEAQRRAMPYCMGSLVWQLNDCWPGTSWSIIDYDLKEKIAYEEVTEAYESTIVSVQEEEKNYAIYIISDGEDPIDADLVIQISDFYGKKKFIKKIRVHHNAKSSTVHFRLSKKIIEKLDTTSIYLNVLLFKKKQKNSDFIYDSKYYHFVKPNQLKLPPPDFHIEKDSNGVYSFKSSTYCPNVMILGENGEETTYLGVIGPHSSMYYGSNTDGIKWLDDLMLNPSKIKCLNTLFKK